MNDLKRVRLVTLPLELPKLPKGATIRGDAAMTTMSGQPVVILKVYHESFSPVPEGEVIPQLTAENAEL